MYLLLLSLIYLAFISLGLPDSLLGAAWPTIYPAMGVSMSAMGAVTMTVSVCTICSSLLSERLVRRFGTRNVTISSVFLTALALLGYASSTQYWHLLLWALPFGLGAGAFDAALNNYVALHYNARHMSWLHCFWGVGTIISPSLMSYALRHADWHRGYFLVAVLQIAIGIILLLTAPVWNIHQKPTQQSRQEKPLGVHGALKIRGVLPMLLGFFFYCATESTVMYWASSYLVTVQHIPTETAAALGGLCYLGITAGRFVSGFLAPRLGDRNMIRLGTAVALLGVACLLLPVDSDLVWFGGFLLVGLGCAPIYPSIIHSTPTAFGPENSQAIIGIQMAFAYTGSTLMPPLFGLLAEHISMRLLPPVLLLCLGGMIFLTEFAFRLCKETAPN